MPFVYLPQSSDVSWSGCLPATSVYFINLSFVGDGDHLMR